jgi:hypothetical protein
MTLDAPLWAHRSHFSSLPAVTKVVMPLALHNAMACLQSTAQCVIVKQDAEIFGLLELYDCIKQRHDFYILPTVER